MEENSYRYQRRRVEDLLFLLLFFRFLFEGERETLKAYIRTYMMSGGMDGAKQSHVMSGPIHILRDFVCCDDDDGDDDNVQNITSLLLSLKSSLKSKKRGPGGCLVAVSRSFISS